MKGSLKIFSGRRKPPGAYLSATKARDLAMFLIQNFCALGDCNA